MNIIIPLGGKGERFAKEGYAEPKPLIRVLHKEMIRHVIDRLSVRPDEDHVFILYANSPMHSGFVISLSDIIRTFICYRFIIKPREQLKPYYMGYHASWIRLLTRNVSFSTVIRFIQKIFSQW